MTPQTSARHTKTTPTGDKNPNTGKHPPKQNEPLREAHSAQPDPPVGEPNTGLDHPRQWTIELPWSAPPVKPNGGHGNVYAHAAKVKRARQTMGLLARNAGLPAMVACRVELVWYVPDRRKRDVDNLVWTLKPLCDALSSNAKPWDHLIVPDDTPEFMTKPMPRIVYAPDRPKRMVLIVTEIVSTGHIENRC